MPESRKLNVAAEEQISCLLLQSHRLSVGEEEAIIQAVLGRSGRDQELVGGGDVDTFQAVPSSKSNRDEVPQA